MRIGVIGIGNFGKNHVRIFKELGHEVKIQEIDELRKIGAMKKYDITEFKSWMDVDAVCITTSSDTHYDLVKYWLSNSVHVFCEKPLCFEYEQARELIELSEKKNRILAVGHIFRFTQGAKLFKKLYDILTPNFISMKFHNDKLPRKDSDIMFNLGIHYLDLLDFIGMGKGKIVDCKKSLNDGYLKVQYHNCEVDILLEYDSTKKQRKLLLNNSYSKSTIDLSINNNEPLKDELLHFVECVEKNVYPVNVAEAEIIKTLENLK